LARNNFSHGTKFLMDGIEHVVIRKEHNEIVVELIKYKQTKTYSLYDLEMAFDEERLAFEDNGNRLSKIKIDVEQLNENDKAELKMKLDVLQPVIKGYYHEIVLDEYLQTLQNEKGLKVSKASFYNWKKLWEKYGDARFLLNRKSGPQNRRTQKEVMSTLEKIMGENLYSGEDIPYRYIYRLYKDSIKNVNSLRDDNEKAIVRSFQTIWRVIKEKRDYYRQNAAREGYVAARLMRDGSKFMVDGPQRPLERVELDWTPIDLKMVDPRTLESKNAWLVYAIDVFSGNPLGFYITFDYPDSFAIKQCLLHCFLPKVYLKRLYPDVQKEWTAYGIPKELVIDNATSNNSYDMEEICNVFGIDLLFPEVQAGHKKGTVERGQKTFNDIVHSIKGSTFANIFAKKQYDSKGNACITLQAFYYIAHIIFVDIISHNWSHSRIGGTPHHIWERAFLEDPSLIKELPFTKKDMKLALCGGHEKRKIQSKGVIIEETWFWSEDLMKLRNKMRQEGDDEKQVVVRFDFADIKKVYVENPYDYSLIDAYIDPNRIKEYEKHYDLEPSLPIPFQQIRAICLKEGRGRRNFDDTHVIEALKNIKAIQIAQEKDKRNEYKQTLQEEMQMLENIALQSFDFENLSAPEGQDTFLYVGELSEEELKRNTLKKSKKENKKTESTVEQNFSEVKVNKQFSFGIDDDDLPIFEVLH
jgi:putative transposase